MVGVGAGTDSVSCKRDQLSEGTRTGMTMIGLPISIASRPSSLSSTSGGDAGAGVALEVVILSHRLRWTPGSIHGVLEEYTWSPGGVQVFVHP